MDTTNHIKEAFTELAPDYSNTMDKELNQFWGISYPEFVERLVNVAAVKPGEKVLDIATGTATIPIKLMLTNQPQERVVGLDITPAMLQHGLQVIASHDTKNLIDLVCASAMDMPFANGIFDVIICGLGTHHMNVPRMLLEAKRPLANLYLESSNGYKKKEITQVVCGKLKEEHFNYADLEGIFGIYPPRVSVLENSAYKNYMESKQQIGADLAHLKPPSLNAKDEDVK